MQPVFRAIGNRLARYLTTPLPGYDAFATVPTGLLKETLRPCDILLIEGNSRISTAIKYLTQSTWSHSSFYIGDGSENPLIEADLVHGVIQAPLEKYRHFNVRICRPVNLRIEDQQRVIAFVQKHLGDKYDLKNIVDLVRYLFPTPPVPSRFRRSMIAFGSGDPTKAICSTLIAQAFQSVSYPILPREMSANVGETRNDDRIIETKHYSHFTPRDFDLSPYFTVIKPAMVTNFNYQKIKKLTSTL